jgi:ABC-type glycerol-3-phosphate transport system permease component
MRDMDQRQRGYWIFAKSSCLPRFFASSDQGIDWALIAAAALMTSAPLLMAFLLFQRQFVQSFMRAGIR